MSFFHLVSPIRWVFLFHAGLGSLALAVFIIPLLSKKGGKLHRRVGWIYTYAMILVSFSAFIITPWRAFFDPERMPSSQVFAFFLAFIAVLTLTSLWYGIVVLRFKNRNLPSRAIYHIGPAIGLILAAVTLVCIGIYTREMLLIFFPLLGIIVAREQLHYWLGTPNEKMHWWYAHMSGMFVACIATITAFLVTVPPRLSPLPIARSPILWLAPGIILGQILKRWTASYRKRYSAEGQLKP